MGIRNEVTEKGFITKLAVTEAQLVLSVSEDVTIAANVPPILPVGPVVLLVDSDNDIFSVRLDAAHGVLGNMLVVTNINEVNDFVLQDPDGTPIATVGEGESVIIVCVSGEGADSVWSKVS